MISLTVNSLGHDTRVVQVWYCDNPTLDVARCISSESIHSPRVIIRQEIRKGKIRRSRFPGWLSKAHPLMKTVWYSQKLQQWGALTAVPLVKNEQSKLISCVAIAYYIRRGQNCKMLFSPFFFKIANVCMEYCSWTLGVAQL